MGRRRQGDTEPDRRDDSRHMQERALAAADQDQLDDEGFIRSAAAASRPDPEALERTRYPEDQLDNQDPHGKHARLTLDAPAQELNTQARVGESPKPGTALRLERSGSETPSDRSPGPRD